MINKFKAGLERFKARFTIEPKTSSKFNDTFVYIVHVAQENNSIKRTLLALLNLPPLQRQSALKLLLEDLHFKHAPSEFIEALAYLVDDDIADALRDKLAKI